MPPTIPLGGSSIGAGQHEVPVQRSNIQLGARYYRPELDVLRFFAFFLVFLSHVVPGDQAFFAKAHIPPMPAGLIISLSAGGAFGVDLFFTLSSFLITTLLLRGKEGYGAINVKSFYIRRMLRIWPLYFVFLFIIAPQRQTITSSPAVRIILLVFAFAVLTAVGHYEDYSGAKSLITYPAITVACVALMLSALGSQMSVGSPLVRVFSYLGRISYGLYVFHWMFIVSLGVPSAHEPLARVSRAAVALIVTTATAAASYQFLEKPFLLLKEKFALVKSRPV